MIIPTRPRISFSSTCCVQFIEPRTSLSSSESDAYWYKASEIEAFHAEARTYCRTLRDSDVLHGSAVVASRGLEMRLSPARQKRKRLTLQCVSMAAKKLKDSDQVARIAKRCSEWVVKVAYTEGQRDFIRAYADDKIEQSHLPPLPAMTPFPLPLKAARPAKPQAQKRSTSCPSEPGICNTDRCVRRRTSCC